MGKKATSTICVIIFIVALLAYILSGAINLIRTFTADPLYTIASNPEKGRYVKGKVMYVDGPIYTITHTVNGIPVAKEYFYEAGLLEDENVFFVRASKNFAKKAASGKEVTVKGKIRKADDMFENYIEDVVKECEEQGYTYNPIGYQYDNVVYLDNLTVSQGLLRIISMILTFGGLGVLIFFIGNTPVQQLQGWQKTLSTVCLIVTLIGLAGMMHSISYIF